MQQDAEEAWGQLVSSAADKLSWVHSSMDLTLSTSIKCDEATEEVVTGVEVVNKLRVAIGSGVSTYMIHDLASGLVEKITKNSPSLNRSATYTKTSQVSRLPKYLTINFVRFQWKATERIKAKILKRVSFPHELDMTFCCTPELVESMKPYKEHIMTHSEAARVLISYYRKRLNSIQLHLLPCQRCRTPNPIHPAFMTSSLF